MCIDLLWEIFFIDHCCSTYFCSITIIDIYRAIYFIYKLDNNIEITFLNSPKSFYSDALLSRIVQKRRIRSRYFYKRSYHLIHNFIEHELFEITFAYAPQIPYTRYTRNFYLSCTQFFEQNDCFLKIYYFQCTFNNNSFIFIISQNLFAQNIKFFLFKDINKFRRICREIRVVT